MNNILYIKYIKKINNYILIDSNNNIVWQLNYNQIKNINKFSKNLNYFFFTNRILYSLGLVTRNNLNEF